MEVIYYVSRLPLALKALGSFQFDMSTYSESLIIGCLILNSGNS